MAIQSGPSDEALVARVAGRDPEALSCLYDRYRAVVFSLALRILRDRAEAEEVLTDVFFQAWRSAPGFDPLRGSVSSWLMNLGRSRAIDRLRARSRRAAGMTALTREESARAAASSIGGPERDVCVMEKRRRIGRALDGLSPQQRDAVELAYYSGLSHSEIASRLGEPLGTVKTRIRQALLALRDSLADDFGG